MEWTQLGVLASLVALGFSGASFFSYRYLNSAFMEMTRSNGIPFWERWRLLRFFDRTDRALSAKVAGDRKDRDERVLTSDFLDALQESTKGGDGRIYFAGVAYNQRAEALVGADLAVALLIRNHLGVHHRWCILQAKKFSLVTENYPEVDAKSDKAQRQARLMEEYHPAANYLLYNPPTLQVNGGKLPFGTRVLTSAAFRHLARTNNGRLPPVGAMTEGVGMSEFFVNFNRYSLSGIPPKDVVEGCYAMIVAAFDLTGTRAPIELGDFFAADGQFVLAPLQSHCLVYKDMPLRQGAVVRAAAQVGAAVASAAKVSSSVEKVSAPAESVSTYAPNRSPSARPTLRR